MTILLPTSRARRRPDRGVACRRAAGPIAAAALAGLLPVEWSPAQVRVRPTPPVLVDGTILDDRAGGEPGRAVQMLESPNIDRFLRKAQDFFGRDDYRGAIKILQDVIEGRTLEDPAAPGDPTEPKPADPAADSSVWLESIEDAANAVFSSDQRLYRPVRRLCHELLAGMPAEGIALFRSLFEVEAERALEQARSIEEHEAVYTRWFATLAAARAMLAAGDRLMDQGTFRAAIHTYRYLLEVYPPDGRALASIDDTYLRFKIAVCLRFLGDERLAADTLTRLASERPDATLRLMGELRAVTDLATSESSRVRAPSRPRDAGAATRVFARADERLVPLWEHRFADPNAYRSSRASEQTTQIFVSGGNAMSPTPKHAAYVPGGSVLFDGTRVALLDHYRLREFDRLTGRMTLQGEASDRPPPPKQNTPHTRIPAYDFAVQRVATDGTRYFLVVGPENRNLSGMTPVLLNRLDAVDRRDATLVWTTDRNLDAFKELTFLSTPTVVGARVLVPVLQRGTYGLMSLDAATGTVLFHVRLHREGTNMARAPAVQVAIEAGTAFVHTNAGAVAAIDAHTGALRWIRRYERTHPFREHKVGVRRAGNDNPFGVSFFQEEEFWGFAPSELIVHDGLVVFAPTDGRVLHCLDGTTGEPVWMLSRMDNHAFVIGHNRELLLLGGPDYVVGVAMRTGVRLWREDLPPHTGSNRWRGRGCVVGDRVLIPGSRHILVMDLTSARGFTPHAMPTFSYGREALSGDFNLFASGPYLAAVYEGGVELYSTAEALSSVADACDDRLERASFQAQAGDLLAAVETLTAMDLGDLDEPLRATVSGRTLTLTSELALAMAVRGARNEALALLERCRSRLVSGQQRQHWHLARIEVFQALGDLEALANEQEALYALMGSGG